MEESYVRDTALHEINPSNPRKFQKLDDMYLGTKVAAILDADNGETIPYNIVNYFRLRCLDFLIEASQQIMKTSSFDDKTFSNLRALDPENFLGREIKTIAPLLTRFKHIISEEDVQDIDTEWRQLRNCTDEVKEIKHDNVVEF